MTPSKTATRRATAMLVVMAAAMLAIATCAGDAVASMASKHGPSRPFCAGKTKRKAVADIKKTWDTLLNGRLALTSDQRFAMVDGSDDPTYRATLDDLVAQNAALLKAVTVRVGRVACTGKAIADVDYLLRVDGATSAGSARTGTAVLVGRRWKASTTTVCDLFAPDDPSLSQRGPCAL